MNVVTEKLDPEFESILNKFSEFILSLDLDKIKFRGEPDDGDDFTSQKYLDHMLSKDSEGRHEGYPEVVYGIDIGGTKHPNDERVPYEVQDVITELSTELNAFLGTRNCAVTMLYPENGYMGWHHNANAPGYNILLSYSIDGDGFFRYVDPTTKEIVTLQDTPGWSIKVGYYGSFEQENKIVWHCARTKKIRFTIAFIVPKESMWHDMCEDIFENYSQ